ncbi:MAG: alpha-L-arabinofuranosidase C-terminal domain-containing protein [Fimbriimonas sp.]
MLNLLILNAVTQGPVRLNLDLTKPGVAVSPMLYGHMTEEINFSYDGGLYGELVRNRAFLDDAKKPAHWAAAGPGASISLEKTGPSTARPTALRVRGAVANEGYWGISVRPGSTYRLEVWAKSDVPGPIDASIESADGSVVYASAQLVGTKPEWKKLRVPLKISRQAARAKDARLVLRTGSDRSVWFSQVSLFPPTFKNRENGNRPDLMKMLADMKPKFLRFPGGNYLEGNTIAERFPWKETLGPIEGRPGHPSPWGYRSSDGLGLHEFLLWCEDTGAEPLLGVFAGYALRGEYVKPGPDLVPFVQEALDEIEYIVGDAKTTKWGAVRAKNGHPKPFPLRYVEVGNEDGFDKSGSYEGRFVQFFDAIKAKYPHLKVISSTGGKDWLGAQFPIKRRTPDLWDEHYYSEAWDMMAMATKYDSYDRTGPKVFVGEWAAHDTVAPWVAGANAGPTPNMKCTLGDAAFMTGLERNSDVVEMACYAPLLVNVNPGGRQWSLNLIGYDNLEAFGSPSYYAQKLFAENLGDRTVVLDLAGVPKQRQGTKELPGIFASATKDTKSGRLFVKLVNALPMAQEVVIDLQGARLRADGTLTVLSGDLKAVNTIQDPLHVAPVVTKLKGLKSSFSQTLSAHSVSVLSLRLK